MLTTSIILQPTIRQVASKGWPKLPREMSLRHLFFRPAHPGKKCRTVADTSRQGKSIKTLATHINRLLQL